MNWPLVGLLLVAASACGPSGSRLMPVAEARADHDEHAAIAHDGGVTVVVEATPWPGDAFISERVFPLRVTVSNLCDRPVTVRYRDFELVSEHRRYPALPPFDIGGTVPTIDPRPDIVHPTVEHEGFAIADRYVPFYPGIRSYNGPFSYDHDYHATYFPHWQDREVLPTPEMIAAALPEGVVEPKGYVTGWLYFGGTVGEHRRVTLQASLGSPDDRRVARLVIPFERE